MRHALRSWTRIEKAVRTAARLALFLDFDGTLAPIRSDPDRVHLGTRARRVLRSLAAAGRARVAIVSGRGLSDLCSRAGLTGIALAANHGSELKLPGHPVRRLYTAGDLAVIRRLAARVRALCGNVPGLRIENKGPVLAVHFRRVAERRRHEVLRAFHAALGPFVPRLTETRGKMVVEARSRGLPTKYQAVRILLKDEPRTTLAICIGDDRTDLDAFRAVRGRGLSIQVGTDLGEGAADYYVEGPGEVVQLLRRIAETENRNDIRGQEKHGYHS